MLISPEQRAVEDRLMRQGRRMQSVATPAIRFIGLLAVAPPIDPQTALGSDPREKCVCEVLRDSQALSLNENDYVSDDRNNQWQVVYRDDNPGDFTVKFWLAKVIAGDQ